MKMKNSILVAEEYFKLANKAALSEMRDLLSDTATYSSSELGVYFKPDQILEMMQSFFKEFRHLNWNINEIKEIRLGVVEIDFLFNGLTVEGNTVIRLGTEYIVVNEGKIEHIEVRFK